MGPVVVVSQRVDHHISRNETRDALDQRVTVFLREVGVIPILVPNSLGALLEQWLDVVNPDGVLLTGGNDIGVEIERDETEEQLVIHAERNNLPLLGICRGMQFLSHRQGAVLEKVKGHVATRVKLEFNEGQQFPLEVNSYHNLALATCPDGFQVTACSADGVIKAVHHLARGWEGWMWHPEREDVFNPIDIARAKEIFHRKSLEN